MFVIVWLTTFFFILPTILAISDEDNCKCPPNEELGQRSCNGCEPNCDNPRPEFCTLKFCSCSCDCSGGLLRNSRTKQCVPQEQCPTNKQ
ncbi:hypothetical protein GPALN_002175 [Globodera pallida]|nr:hypothetical protein GPALN_002175 [Globodera pallida]